jgi:hypothetical protein
LSATSTAPDTAVIKREGKNWEVAKVAHARKLQTMQHSSIYSEVGFAQQSFVAVF